MTTPNQDHQAATQPVDQTKQPATRQPWRRPTVTFVPMQATAGNKSAVGNDGTLQGAFNT